MKKRIEKEIMNEYVNYLESGVNDTNNQLIHINEEVNNIEKKEKYIDITCNITFIVSLLLIVGGFLGISIHTLFIQFSNISELIYIFCFIIGLLGVLGSTSINNLELERLDDKKEVLNSKMTDLTKKNIYLQNRLDNIVK